MLCRLVHHLCPDRQRERGAVAAGNNCCRLIKSNPNTAGERARVTEKPGVFVIVGRAGLAGSGQFETQGPCAGGRPAGEDFFHYLRGHPGCARVQRRR
jgi:hypothetical protein